MDDGKHILQAMDVAELLPAVWAPFGLIADHFVKDYTGHLLMFEDKLIDKAEDPVYHLIMAAHVEAAASLKRANIEQQLMANQVRPLKLPESTQPLEPECEEQPAQGQREEGAGRQRGRGTRAAMAIARRGRP